MDRCDWISDDRACLRHRLDGLPTCERHTPLEGKDGEIVLEGFIGLFQICCAIIPKNDGDKDRRQNIKLKHVKDQQYYTDSRIVVHKSKQQMLRSQKQNAIRQLYN